MRKYLIRSGFNILREYSPLYAISRNFLGGNSGNLMFSYGTMRALAGEDVVFYPTYYKCEWKDEEIDYINSEFEAFIIPLADAFRQDFVYQLENLTDFIKKLKIPAVVIGCGLRASFEDDLNEPFEFDNTVKKFVKTVLEHSSKLGLRGEITADYLGKLGFRQDKDFTPIGCPSLYMNGKDIYTRHRNSGYEKVSVVANTLAKEPVRKFLANNFYRFEDSTLIQQKIRELRYMYLGGEHRIIDDIDNVFGRSGFIDLHKEDRVRFFLNVKDWIEYMKNRDLFFGNRFHGTVAAILAGTEHVFIPLDCRTKELCDIHRLTNLDQKRISPDDDIRELIGNLDMRSFEKSHMANLKHYIEFLEDNGIKHNFDNDLNIIENNIPVNLSAIKSANIIHCYDCLPEREQRFRINQYNTDRFEPKDRK